MNQDSQEQNEQQVKIEDPEEIYNYYNPVPPKIETKEYMSLQDKIQIVDVWKDNLIEELEKIIELSQKFNIIAMDTEFPGVVVQKSQRRFDIPEEAYEYQLIRDNVKETKVIQIGISIADDQGRVPYPISTWQFNFKFDKDRDSIIKESLNLLDRAGIDFNKLNEKGIDTKTFSEYFITSELVLNEDIIWVAFHGGHDFAYLIKMLMNNEIPEKADLFYQQMQYYFPNIYDIKYLIKDMDKVKEFGLARLGTELKINRIGPQHQAGSDSLMTLQVFFKLRDVYFKQNHESFQKLSQVIYGIGKGYINSRAIPISQDDQYGNNYQDFINYPYVIYPPYNYQQFH